MTVRLGLVSRLGLARLLFITDCAGAGDLAGLAAAVVAGGADMLQLRDPSATAESQLDAVGTLRAAAQQRALVANYGDVAIAAKANADVLQLSALGPEAAGAHAALHRWALVGRSCHSAEQVEAAIADSGVAFFTVSPVFNTAGVGSAGLDLVAYAAKAAPPGDPASKPWFAVGGVNDGNLEQVLAAGARRIGVTRAIAAAPDPRAAARILADRLRSAWNDEPSMEQVTFSALSATPPRP